MTSDRRQLHGRVVVAGEARGPALVLDDGLSFAMAFEVEHGRISDVHSGHAGELLRGRVLVMPAGRGSSSASMSLAEAIRLGTAPAAIILGEVDKILAAGAMVARRLYGRTCPIVVLDASALARTETGDHVALSADGTVTLR